MLRIIAHIERLLLEHDCVIVPGFGGFVLQAIATAYRADERLFLPMRKEVVFNANLRHTDGLLNEAYRRAYGVDYQRASLMLEEDIKALRTTLSGDRHLSLGRFGDFSLGEEGQIIFTPGESVVFNADAYGLAPLRFPELPPLVEKRPEREPKGDVLYIPVSRRLIRVVAASAAAVALFLVVSTPVKEVNRAAYTASFIPTRIMSYPPELKESPAAERSAKTDSVAPKRMEVRTTVVSGETREMDRTSPTPKEETSKAEKVSEKPVVPASKKKMYHIVIASFPNAAQADEFLAKVDRKICVGANKVTRDGKVRVYADRFDNREEAERYMASLRKNAKYKDAWLFISR